MGKAQILENLGRGQYRIRLLLKRDEIEARIARLLGRICEINQELGIDTQECREYYSQYSQSSSSEQSKSSESESSFSGVGETPLSFEEQSRINLLKLRKAALVKEKERLESLELQDPEIVAWCADYTPVLQGNIDYGTIEIAREKEKGINIQPGWEGNANYDQKRDGQIEPAIASSPSGIYYNLAMVPGAQKWKPTYRYGIITAINGDLCEIDLDPVNTGYWFQEQFKDVPYIQVNQQPSLSDVPFEYMDCNEVPFDVGDRVIIKFDNYDWNQSKVIGFESEPLPCRRYVYSVVFHRFDSLHIPGDVIGSNSYDDFYRRRYLEIDPFTGEPWWVNKADIQDDFNLSDNWNTVMWRSWYGAGNPVYTNCVWDHRFALIFINYPLLGSIEPYSAYKGNSMAFTLPDTGKLVFFSITPVSVGLFTSTDAKYVLREVGINVLRPRITTGPGSISYSIKVARLLGPIHFPPGYENPAFCQNYYVFWMGLVQDWPYGAPKPYVAKNIHELSGNVNNESQEWIDNRPYWPLDDGIPPVLDIDGNNVWPGGCGVPGLEWQIDNISIFEPQVYRNCVVLNPYSTRRNNNISSENQVYGAGGTYRYFHRISNKADFTHLMVRKTGLNYRIFAKLYSPNVGFEPYNNRLLIADIDPTGAITIISYEDQPMPEYKDSDYIVYDLGQNINADEGMFPPPWMDNLSIRQAYYNAISNKISEVWPGESYAGWSGSCRLMPK